MEKLISLYLFFGICFPLHGQEQTSFRRISPVIKSLILPGSGEYALGNKERGRKFVITEIALVFSAVASYHQSDSESQTYMAFASEHSGAQSSDKSHNYWVDIGNYISIDAYNEEHLRFRENDDLYEDSELWTWDWDSDANRSKFESIRIRSDLWKLGGSFLIGGIVINHIVSAIDALYLKRISALESISFHPKINPSQNSFALQIDWNFSK